jgi:hypothetical protein
MFFNTHSCLLNSGKNYCYSRSRYTVPLSKKTRQLRRVRFPDVTLQQVLATRSVHVERRTARPLCAHHQLNSLLHCNRKNHLCIPFSGNCAPQSQFPHSCVCERFTYSQDRSTYFLQKNRQINYGTT